MPQGVEKPYRCSSPYVRAAHIPALRISAPLAAEGQQVLGMAGLAAHPQKPVLEASALEVSLEFLLHGVRQGPALPGQEFDERRVVLRDDALEQHLLGPVAR